MQVCACQLSLERITLLLARSPLFLLLLLLALLLLFLVAVVAVAADDHIAAISAGRKGRDGRVRLLTIAMAVSARSYCYGCGNENGRYTHLRIHVYMS